MEEHQDQGAVVGHDVNCREQSRAWAIRGLHTAHAVVPRDPPFVPLLCEFEYEYGNVRKHFNGASVCIDPEVAEAIPKGVRKNRKGLLYDWRSPGFEPLMWPHVLLAHESGFGFHRFELEGGGCYT